VILIIAILIGGGITVSTTAINNAKIKTTKDRMAEIYQALGNYLLVNKKLPCPAAMTQKKSSGGASYGAVVGTDGSCAGGGVYSSANATGLVYGALPIKALGLASDMAEDGFGNKFAYVVTTSFTATSGYSKNNYGLIEINENQGSAIQAILPASSSSDKAVFAIISYGSNQLGAFSANSDVANTMASDVAESDNDLRSFSSPSFDFDFYAQDKSSENFDDLIFYKNRNAMLIDFKALSLIPCAAGSVNLAFSGGGSSIAAAAFSFGNGLYSQIVSSSTSCSTSWKTTVASPTLRCGEFGNWDSLATNPCTN
jgi:type II secretory pathway pseudopilin PulG